LRGVDFTVEDGEFVAFVGTNGAGKSTTMRLVNGLLKPDSGEVLVDGVPTTRLKTSELARRVGFLFQNPDNQICCKTVRDELLFGFRSLDMDPSEAARRVDAIIAEFGFNPDDDPFLLNRGTRQLLALASAVVLEPPVLVLDEPTTGLDFRECVKVMDTVRRLHAKGTTILMVCHDMEVVADYAERVMVMSDGRIIDQGPTFDVLRRRSTLEAASLVPPQIVSISLALPRINPALSSTAIARANTLGQMHAAILHATTPDSADANVATTPEGALPEPAIRAQTAGGARTPSVFIDHEGAA
jgi:energy-coupling factor transport system ATP-binding protein